MTEQHSFHLFVLYRQNTPQRCAGVQFNLFRYLDSPDDGDSEYQVTTQLTDIRRRKPAH